MFYKKFSDYMLDNRYHFAEKLKKCKSKKRLIRKALDYYDYAVGDYYSDALHNKRVGYSAEEGKDRQDMARLALTVRGCFNITKPIEVNFKNKKSSPPQPPIKEKIVKNRCSFMKKFLSIRSLKLWIVIIFLSIICISILRNKHFRKKLEAVL